MTNTGACPVRFITLASNDNKCSRDITSHLYFVGESELRLGAVRVKYLAFSLLAWQPWVFSTPLSLVMALSYMNHISLRLSI